METYNLSHFPAHGRAVHVALFHDLQNAAEIRQRLISASTMEGPEGDQARREVDFGFIEASLVVSREHLLTAIQTTLLNSLTPDNTIQTRSHNLHSEILLTLSPNYNISDAIRRFGLSKDTQSLLVVRFESEEEERVEQQERVWREIEGVVKGRLVSLDELEKGKEEGGQVDWAKVDKIYKLSEMNALKLPPTELLNRKKAAAVTGVAIKSVT